MKTTIFSVITLILSIALVSGAKVWDEPYEPSQQELKVLANAWLTKAPIKSEPVVLEPVVVVGEVQKTAPSPLAAKMIKAFNKGPKPSHVAKRAIKKQHCWTQELWQGKLRLRTKKMETVTICDSI